MAKKFQFKSLFVLPSESKINSPFVSNSFFPKVKLTGIIGCPKISYQVLREV